MKFFGERRVEKQISSWPKGKLDMSTSEHVQKTDINKGFSHTIFHMNLTAFKKSPCTFLFGGEGCSSPAI